MKPGKGNQVDRLFSQSTVDLAWKPHSAGRPCCCPGNDLVDGFVSRVLQPHLILTYIVESLILEDMDHFSILNQVVSRQSCIVAVNNDLGLLWRGVD